MKEAISMSIKELDKLEIVNQLCKKLISQKQAADILGVSAREIKRLVKNYRKDGAKGLISKKRRRPSNRHFSASSKELALSLIQEKYVDFGPTLAHEKLVKNHQMKVSLSNYSQPNDFTRVLE